jgi:hypothetical protein
MTEKLTRAGYDQTRRKLAAVEERLARLAARADVSPIHRAEAKRSCEQMRAQYLREIKLYEAEHPEVIEQDASM